MPFSMLCLLLFLATATPLSLADLDLNTCECARATASDRIVGGSEVSPKYSLPYQVYIWVDGYGCGATIINRRYVLTAAHCLYDDNDQLLDQNNTWVIAGEHNKCDSPWHLRKPGWWPNEGGQVFGVERFIRHKEYDSDKKSNDIAILKLNTDIKFGDHVKPACLPTDPDDDFDGMTATVSGWGTTAMRYAEEEPNGKTSCKLKRTSLTILGKKSLWCLWSSKNDATTRMCAFKEGTDTCQGDSGGPLVVVKDRKYVLVGVTSYGRGCADPRNFPGIYARVTNYLEWIADETKDGNCQAR